MEGRKATVRPLHMFLPSFVPRPLEQLPSELDEVKVLVHQENALAQQEVAVREHHKDAPPLGIVEVCEDLQSEPADTDDSEPDLSDADDMDDGAEADDLVEEREAEGDEVAEDDVDEFGEGADIDDPGEPDFGSDGSGSPYVPPSV